MSQHALAVQVADITVVDHPVCTQRDGHEPSLTAQVHKQRQAQDQAEIGANRFAQVSIQGNQGVANKLHVIGQVLQLG